jgi:hypothetical protein
MGMLQNRFRAGNLLKAILLINREMCPDIAARSNLA